MESLKNISTVTELQDKTVEDHGAKITMAIPRDKVCRKVQEAKWECEPLLTPEEEAAL